MRNYLQLTPIFFAYILVEIFNFIVFYSIFFDYIVVLLKFNDKFNPTNYCINQI